MVAHGDHVAADAEHPPRTTPVPGTQRESVQPEGRLIPLGCVSSSAGSPQTPHSAVPAVPQLPSRCRPPHLPPGRRSPASLSGGRPRSIPTFRNRPGGGLAGLIKRAKRFFLRYPGPGASGARPHPGPADSAGLPQGNLLSACPPSSLPPPAPPPASVSPSEKWAQRPGALGRDDAAARGSSQEIPGRGTRGPLSRGQLGRPGVSSSERGAAAPRPLGLPQTGIHPCSGRPNRLWSPATELGILGEGGPGVPAAG